jgi:Na+/H+-dicarboxylate symporter
MNLWKKYTESSLISKLGIGFVLGLLGAIVLRDKAEVLTPLGDVFLNLLKMIVVPLVILSIVTALDAAPQSALKRIGPKTVVYYLFTTFFASALGLISALITNPGTDLKLDNVDTSSVKEPDGTSVTDMIVGIVPTNIVEAIANADMLALIFLSVIVGLAISHLKTSSDVRVASNAEFVSKGIEGLRDISFKLLAGIMLYAPIGVFALTASTLGGQSWNTVVTVFWVMVIYLVTALIHFVVVYLGSILAVRESIPRFLKVVSPVMLTALATGSSSATLPVSLQQAKKAKVADHIAGFVIPLGSTINMDGLALRLPLYAIVGANVAGVHFSVPQLIMLLLLTTAISVGIAGVPGGGPVGTSMLFLQAGLPLEIIGILIGIELLLNQVSTMMNATGDFTASVMIDKTERKHSDYHNENLIEEESAAA